jgi:large repetitive protein
MWSKRFVFLSVLIGLITILCHARERGRSDRGGFSLLSTSKNVCLRANEPPVITGQSPNPIPVSEDQALTITFNHLLVTDPDNVYPTGFSLNVSGGSNYSVNGNTITPDNDFVGTLSVQVSVFDGTASSNTFALQVLVTDVNDAPVVVGQTPNPLTTLEETSLTINFSNISVQDSDNTYPNGFSLTVMTGSNYTVNGTSITPVTNFTGILTVPVQVNDGQANSNIFNVQVSVLNSNDAPVITGQNPISIAEDQSLVITFTHLIVSDPDDTYPTGFTLSVGAGSNYTVNGTTITPAANFEGTLTIPVTVNDGDTNSNTYSLIVTVNGSNDVPLITGQNALSTNEDNSIRILLTDLLVTDSDNTYPGNFTLTILSGSNYSISGTTVIPNSNFFGSLSVPVLVNDGSDNSNTFNVIVTVNAVNDAPVITGQQNLSTLENQPIELKLTDLIVTDIDNTYPNGFTMTVTAGTAYSVSGNTITPIAGFSGILSVPVVVNDGSLSSNSFTVLVEVVAVNDPPMITGQNDLSVVEDNSVTIQLADLIVTDSDNTYPNGFTLTVHPGNDYSVSGTTVIPSANFYGSLSVGVSVNDGATESQIFPANVTVMPVNDAPVITGQTALNTNEDQPLTINLTDLSVTDPDNSFPEGFTISLSAGDNYTIAGNTVTPDVNFKGVLFVPVQVNDGELNSNVLALQINVADVNDPPVIVGQLPVSTPEDTPVMITLAHLDVLDTDSPFPSGFTLNISSGTNYSVTGSLITPAQDFNGTLNISLTVNDGVSNSEPFIFQIQVGDSNDPPVITGQSTVSTNEEEPFAISLGHLSVIDPDNVYPNGFTLLVGPGVDYTVTGEVITPALNFSGTLVIPVRVNDGVNNSPTFDFKLDVLGLNDAPSFDPIPNVTVSENANPGTVQITNITKGPNEDAQLLTFSVSSSDPTIVPDPIVSYNGAQTASLSYTLVPNRSGVVTVNVVAIDNGGAEAPNQNSYASSFQIIIAEINSAPTLDVIPSQSINEDSPLINIPIGGITAGVSESQPLSVTASTNKPELFEVFEISYASPASTGSLQVKPVANAYGTANVTITVTDNGSNIPPSVSSITRSFVLSILPINDPPEFVSKPLTVAAVDELYEYIVEIDDGESESLPITAEEKPSWASLSTISGKKAKLSGVPSISATGSSNVKLVVKDGLYSVDQSYTLIVNSRPTITSFNVTSQEDADITFQQSQFANAYTDINQHPIQAVQITEMPVAGSLFLAGQEVQPFDTIAAASFGGLMYKPDKEYYGTDDFQWKASDGYHFSKAPANVNISISPINDPPTIMMETDTLEYDVNGEAALLTTLFDVHDPDNDSLASADIMFAATNYQAEYDMLSFENSKNVKVTYDLLNGKLSLRGNAPIAEYRNVIRTIKYNHLNTIDPYLKLKTLSFTVNDGKLPSEAVNRFVAMKFSFVHLDIPTGFTPNGDSANDTWVISRPGGVEDFDRAVISVFNKRGFLVHRQVGFTSAWDGRFNGETLPAGTYYFTIDLKLRSKRLYKGVVTILR